MKVKKISSGWTIPMLVLMLLLWIVGIPYLIFSTGVELKLDGGQIFALIIFLLLIGLTVYLALNLAVVTISETGINFKKIFGAEKTYSFDQIGLPSSFRFKRLKFTLVRMKDVSGGKEKFLILNNNALLSGERMDAEEILLALMKK
jgi:hypothetical protein